MRNVLLSPAMEREVEEAVASGEYSSASEVVNEALRLWQRSRDRHSLAIRLLAAEIELGWQQLDRGERVPYDIEKVIARSGTRS